MSRTSRLCPQRLRRTALALALVAPALALIAAPSTAAAPTYLPAEKAVASTVLFSYVGGEQTFVVPDGVYQIDVDAVGAPGATSVGGRGARVTATLSVEPGDVFYVRVGGGGGSGWGGWNGGGTPVAGSNGSAGGGGGATDLRTCGASDTGCSQLGSRVVVAGGGGGAGGISGGGDVAAGDAGAAAPDYAGVRGPAGGGGAGTASAGGAGGVDASYANGGRGNGNAGTYGTGGSSRYTGTTFRGAGGGGGGLYGGGSGGTNQYYGAGGGGGSSLVPAGGALALAERTVGSQLKISYDAGPVTDVSVDVADDTIVATGADSTTVSATASLEDGTKVSGLEVVFDSTDPSQSFGPVTDHGDGTYSATLMGSTTAGAATVTATAKGSTGVYDVSGSAGVTTEGYVLNVGAVTGKLVATGADSLTVSATAESASGTPLSGLPVTFQSSDPGQSFGTVTDHGDGSYSATLSGSTTVGTATITPSATGTPTVATGGVETEGYTVTVKPVTTKLVATGLDSVPVTATAKSTSGVLLPGLDVSFGSSDAGQSFGPVTDAGDGTYVATLSGSTTIGSANLGVTVTGAGAPTLVGASVATEGYSVTLRPIDDAILGTGTATVPVTALARSASRAPMPGLTVSFVSTDPGQSFGTVTDNGDGTYSATLTGSTTPGVSGLRAVVTGAGSPSTPEVELVTDRYDTPSITATLAPSSSVRNGWFRTPVTVTFACAGTLPLTASCPAPVLLSTDGRDQTVSRTVTDTFGSTGSVTSGAVNIDATRPGVIVTGARSGATYKSPRKLVCKGTDALSGLASCKVTTKKQKSKKRTLVRWTATAVDRAGNTATSTGSYTIKAKVKKRR
ncbi:MULTISPECIES: invasin domain 3-containing protein [unclassified Nocardioides]|uniref:invasin domain 3-containing protein n=1 Tax=unclassified Nocardioides TaxID=2615069 RepID=UPI000A9747EB|nr:MULTISPECIES: invasin domain 3-containing protein [unclassified Nocardioides]